MTQNLDKMSFSYKTAGAAQALCDLGLEKHAGLLGGAMKLTGSLIGRAGMGIGKGAWRLGSGIVGSMGKGLGQFGHGLVGSAEKAGLPQGVAQFLRQNVGKNMGRDAAGFGLFSGGLEALQADPGERLNAFGRGFLYGGLGGAAWAGGSNLARRGLQKGLGAFGNRKLYGQLATTAKPGFLGKLPEGASRLKSMGAKTLIGGVPLVGAFGMSSLAPMGHTSETPMPWTQQPQRFGPVTGMPQRYNPYGTRGINQTFRGYY